MDLVSKPEGKRLFEDLNIDVTTVLMLVLNIRCCCGLGSFRIEFSGEFL
jgi:hypothetical protein